MTHKLPDALVDRLLEPRPIELGEKIMFDLDGRDVSARIAKWEPNEGGARFVLEVDVKVTSG